MNNEVRCDCTFVDDGNVSWCSVCPVPIVEWWLDCENCRHLTVVGLHDTGLNLSVKRTCQPALFTETFWAIHHGVNISILSQPDTNAVQTTSCPLAHRFGFNSPHCYTLTCALSTANSTFWWSCTRLERDTHLPTSQGQLTLFLTTWVKEGHSPSCIHHHQKHHHHHHQCATHCHRWTRKESQGRRQVYSSSSTTTTTTTSTTTKNTTTTTNSALLTVTGEQGKSHKEGDRSIHPPLPPPPLSPSPLKTPPTTMPYHHHHYLHHYLNHHQKHHHYHHHHQCPTHCHRWTRKESQGRRQVYSSSSTTTTTTSTTTKNTTTNNNVLLTITGEKGKKHKEGDRSNHPLLPPPPLSPSPLKTPTTTTMPYHHHHNLYHHYLNHHQKHHHHHHHHHHQCPTHCHSWTGKESQGRRRVYSSSSATTTTSTTTKNTTTTTNNVLLTVTGEQGKSHKEGDRSIHPLPLPLPLLLWRLQRAWFLAVGDPWPAPRKGLSSGRRCGGRCGARTCCTAESWAGGQRMVVITVRGDGS